MGVDCCIFAKGAKRYMFLGRARYFPHVPEGAPVTGDYFLGYFAGRYYEDHEYGDQDEAVWFINEHGKQEQYFIVTDHEDRWYFEVARDGGYVEQKHPRYR